MNYLKTWAEFYEAAFNQVSDTGKDYQSTLRTPPKGLFEPNPTQSTVAPSPQPSNAMPVRNGKELCTAMLTNSPASLVCSPTVEGGGKRYPQGSYDIRVTAVELEDGSGKNFNIKGYLMDPTSPNKSVRISTFVRLS